MKKSKSTLDLASSFLKTLSITDKATLTKNKSQKTALLPTKNNYSNRISVLRRKISRTDSEANELNRLELQEEYKGPRVGANRERPTSKHNIRWLGNVIEEIQ